MDNELLEKLVSGEIKLHEVENYTSPDKAVELRRRAIERITGKKLDAIGQFHLDVERASARNIENMIGAIQIPLGVAGPLEISGEHAKGRFYIPLATTEGALVASTNRGCKAVTESGGARVFILDDKMTRSALFRLKSTKDAVEFKAWVNENKKRIMDIAMETSHHLKMGDIKIWIAGRNVWLRFEGETGDAMGMNMITIAVEHACSWIEKEFNGAKFLSASGNMCVDKKPSAINMITGRGKTVIAEALIPREIVGKVLKTSPEAMVDVAYRKNLVGSALAGSYGFNAHFANIIAAMYLALGQDAAHVVEGSHGISLFEMEGENLHVSVTIPAVQVGTVGGGTGLDTQREALSILGVSGGGNPPGENSKKLAEIIGAAVLAGEISLIAALAAGHLGKAHKALGRGKKLEKN